MILKSLIIVFAVFSPFNLVESLVPKEEAHKTNKGNASIFYPHDGHNNGLLACDGKKWKDKTLPLCAYRNMGTPQEQKLYCGDWVLVENLENGKTAWCRIADRGPYGKISPSGKWFNGATDYKRARKSGRPLRKGKFRGIIDLSPTVAKALGSDGMINVKVHRWENKELDETLNRLFWLDRGRHKLRRTRPRNQENS